MKKMLMLLLIIPVLLWGCVRDPQGTSDPDSAAVTEGMQTQTSILDGALPWDEKGMLLEVPLNVPDALHYTVAAEFQGDLLLWNVDDHLQDRYILELCVVDLTTGAVLGQRDVPMKNYCQPQVLGESLFLCDNLSGEILQLDKKLETVRSWECEPSDGTWIVGADETLYVHIWDRESYTVDLATGERKPILGDGNSLSSLQISGEYAIVEYYREDNGTLDCMALDLRTGRMEMMPENIRCHTAQYMDGYWLCEYYSAGCVYYLGTGDKVMVTDLTETDSLKLLRDGLILATVDEGCGLSIHDMTGKCLSRCVLSARPYSLTCSVVIPSEAYGGYFLVASDYGNGYRLLYWDSSDPQSGEDIPFEPLPQPSAAEQQLLDRVEEMEQEYGIAIYFGSRAQTEFYDFYAQQVTDWVDISNALDVLDNALSVYPEGFFRQLRYGPVRGLRIHLVGKLESINPEEYTHNYVAFVQNEYDCNVMGVDIYQAEEQYYYHEISHIIDAFLEYDASEREGALYSEEKWNSLNPDWFPGYTFTYSLERELQDFSSFIDSYSTIKPTEDRARILQYAMISWGDSYFEEGSILKTKLRYYCSCIRDAFDTSTWPQTLLWEQFL